MPLFRQKIIFKNKVSPYSGELQLLFYYSGRITAEQINALTSIQSQLPVYVVLCSHSANVLKKLLKNHINALKLNVGVYTEKKLQKQMKKWKMESVAVVFGSQKVSVWTGNVEQARAEILRIRKEGQ
ncbi:Hypothetical_protein [Hexamita inflata]|uniref:Hypothetical_protein n=1 Tax=Hexamita inflata TaxID=28002 RepID=A0AA86V3X9_9EUKA|nr:Hypothetical protein HINF_LOCUS43788 [Hexamita inflata]